MTDFIIDENINDFKWYVLGLAKNREHVLARSLLGLAEVHPDKIRNIYLPTQILSSWKNNKQVKREIPAKPGYLFVESIDGYLDNKETKLQIQTNYRVVGIVSQEEIQKIKDESINMEEINDFEIKIGSKVIVNKGIFIGLPGQVQKVGENGSVTVRVWLMHGCEPTDIDVHTTDIGPAHETKEGM